MKLKTKIKMG